MQILICDDDAVFAEQCRSSLLALAQKHGVDASIDTVASGQLLLFHLEAQYARADLIYLDYHMPELNGIETARTLRAHNIAADIVFYTVDDSHAIEGYDVEALHYVVKNRTDGAKFEEIFLKAVNRVRKRSQELLTLTCAGERRNIAIDDISYFEVFKRIITVHYGRGETFEFYSTLSRLEEMLFGSGFLRIHSSYLVSQKHIHLTTTQSVAMKDGALLPIGRAYSKNVEKAMGK